MRIKEIKDFSDDLAYKFVCFECMSAEFANITCGDAQEVRIHLKNFLEQGLIDFLDKQGLIKD